ncbi:hypothetical protein E2C01_002639 [Portunus trituberculatus]|uniref:Uncharacterized protein n=1 Tax=Portunus trituberculatus TaxID=210409 RepID=A0A5B7CRA4_PORTR|nr:hypothetical protein [Portunus trituberculatus]
MLGESPIESPEEIAVVGGGAEEAGKCCAAASASWLRQLPALPSPATTQPAIHATTTQVSPPTPHNSTTTTTPDTTAIVSFVTPLLNS